MYKMRFLYFLLPFNENEKTFSDHRFSLQAFLFSTKFFQWCMFINSFRYYRIKFIKYSIYVCGSGIRNIKKENQVLFLNLY